jgi:hypothetical protein
VVVGLVRQIGLGSQLSGGFDEVGFSVLEGCGCPVGSEFGPHGDGSALLVVQCRHFGGVV